MPRKWSNLNNTESWHKIWIKKPNCYLCMLSTQRHVWLWKPRCALDVLQLHRFELISWNPAASYIKTHAGRDRTHTEWGWIGLKFPAWARYLELWRGVSCSRVHTAAGKHSQIWPESYRTAQKEGISVNLNKCLERCSWLRKAAELITLKMPVLRKESLIFNVKVLL